MSGLEAVEDNLRLLDQVIWVRVTKVVPSALPVP